MSLWDKILGMPANPLTGGTTTFNTGGGTSAPTPPTPAEIIAAYKQAQQQTHLQQQQTQHLQQLMGGLQQQSLYLGQPYPPGMGQLLYGGIPSQRNWPNPVMATYDSSGRITYTIPISVIGHVTVASNVDSIEITFNPSTGSPVTIYKGPIDITNGTVVEFLGAAARNALLADTLEEEAA